VRREGVIKTGRRGAEDDSSLQD